MDEYLYLILWGWSFSLCSFILLAFALIQLKWCYVF